MQLEVVQMFGSTALQGKKMRSRAYQYLIENDLVGIRNKRSIQKWIKDYRENPEETLAMWNRTTATSTGVSGGTATTPANRSGKNKSAIAVAGTTVQV